MAPEFRLLTLGRLAVLRTNAGAVLERVRVRPLSALLLGFVAGEGGPVVGVSREQVMSALWPEDSEAKGRNNLNRLLASLKAELAEDALVGQRMLTLNPQRFSVDLWELDVAIEARDASAALGLYAGHYLSSVDLTAREELDLAASRHRERSFRLFRELAVAHADEARLRGEREAAKVVWTRLLELDPLDNTAATGLLACLTDGGETTSALALVESFRRRVAQSFGVEPDEAFLTETRRVTPIGGVPLPKPASPEGA